MSFIGTFNNISVRDWQNASQVVTYQYRDDEYCISEGPVYTNYDGIYIAGVAANTQFFKRIGNTITNIYSNATVGLGDMRGIGGFGSNTITAVASSGTNQRIGFFREGVVQFFSNIGNTITTQAIWGGVNNLRLGSDACITGDGNIIFATSANLTSGIDIRAYTSNGNTWSQSNIFHTQSNFGFVGTSIATNINGNTMAITCNNPQVLRVYRNNTWSTIDTTSANLGNTDNFGIGKVFMNSDGDKILIPSFTYTNDNVYFGRIFLYEYDGNTYTLSTTIYPERGIYANGIRFGNGCQMTNSADTIVTPFLNDSLTAPAPYGVNILNRQSDGNYIVVQTISGANNNIRINTQLALSNTGQFLYFTSNNIVTANTGNLYLYESA